MTTVDTLNAALIGRYSIGRELGQGGMATVYLARDLRHERDVALKVLHPDLAAALGAERFLAEIRTTANLHHPHILPLHDSGAADGYLFYVMPVTSGETLRSRLDRERQLSVDDAVRIARETLAALDYAHRHGVVHRDIKPENILLHDDAALVADFGIALAVSAAGGQRMTQTGLSLGTPQYMSPEQAMGERQIDGRADVYAVGAVLYEMLTGEPPFTGASVQAIVAKVMTERPMAPRVVRDTVPPHVEAAVMRALAKLPADRFATAAQFADALANAALAPGTAAPSIAAPMRGRSAAMLVGAGVLAGLAVGALVMRSMQPAAPVRTERFEVPINLARRLLVNAGGSGTVALSPDGSRLVFAGRTDKGTSQLMVRELADLEPRAIAGGEDAVDAAVGPDNETIAFVTTSGALKTVSVRGGNPSTLVPTNAAMPSWSEDGRINFQRSIAEPGPSATALFTTGKRAICRIERTGGRIDTLGVLGPPAVRARLHRLTPLPGNKTFLAITDGFVKLIDPSSGQARELFPGIAAAWSPSGHLVYLTREGRVLAVPFDVERSAATGSPVALGEAGSMATADALISVSASGSLLYTRQSTRPAEILWVARDGATKSIDTSLTATGGAFGNCLSCQGRLVDFPALSPDDRRIAYQGRGALWIFDLVDRTSFKLLDRFANYAAWSQDGRFVSYYTQDSVGRFEAWIQRADGSERPRALVGGRLGVVETLWHPDGKTLVYRMSASMEGLGDIFAVPAANDTAAPVRLAATRATEVEPSVSPDGKWLAYVSNETGRNEVYVVPFAAPGGARWSVSTGGGVDPLWAHSGRELFYRDGSGNMRSVDVRTSPTFSTGASRVLFNASGYASYAGHRQYDISRDDQRFLMVRESPDEVTHLVLVRNWTAELRSASRPR